MKGHSDHAKEVANKTIDERVKSPAYSVAQGIDQRFAPIVDYVEVAVNKLHANDTTEPAQPMPDAQFQYQRAYNLSMDLSEQLRTYSTEQITQLKEHNALVKRASATAHDLSQLASTSYGTAQLKIQTLSDTMLSELQRIQATTATLPSAVQASFHDVSAQISSTITDLSAILTAPEPLSEKINKLRDTVQDRVHPVLETATARVQALLGFLRVRAAEKAETLETTANGAAAVNGNAFVNGNGNGTVNGNGTANGNGHT